MKSHGECQSISPTRPSCILGQRGHSPGGGLSTIGNPIGHRRELGRALHEYADRLVGIPMER